jgi:hypothetical protein
MIFTAFGWEFFIETVPNVIKFLDWHFCAGDNHLWFGRLHAVFNRTGENRNDGGIA